MAEEWYVMNRTMERGMTRRMLTYKSKNFALNILLLSVHMQMFLIFA
jgi:hypothetical protein